MNDTWAELIRRQVEIEDVELPRLSQRIKDAAGGMIDERKGLRDELKQLKRALRHEANKQLPLNLGPTEVE